MMNNIKYTTKIDYEAFCEQYVENIKTIYGLTDEDLENIPNNISVIISWSQKIQENYIIEELKKGNLEIL